MFFFCFHNRLKTCEIAEKFLRKSKKYSYENQVLV